ncbi:MAG: TonB-dependent receptor, partial [Gemmatimonadetes bacterium]|nr:TonB-dependent receptor [Gemmatimonadota bacterium]
MRRLFVALLALLALAALAPHAAAQDGTGSVHGIVTDRHGHPEAAVTIVPDPSGWRRTVTGQDGRFRISGLPAGKVTLRALRMGSEPRLRRVAIPPGGDVQVDITLKPWCRPLPDDFPSGPPVNPRDRTDGVAAERVLPDTARAAVQTISQLLAGRAAGMFVRGSSGTVGAGSRIFLRGPSSYFLNNYPIVVIDGARTITDPRALRIDVGGQTPSTIDDLSPEEVESVRVLRGPAATAVYGPAGAAGVLEVTTVRGWSGLPQWLAWAEVGERDAPEGFPANWDQVGITPNGQRLGRCTLRAQAALLCTAVDSLLAFSPLDAYSPFRTGTRRAVGASVRGGMPWLSYAVSGEGTRDLGVLDQNRLTGSSFRGSFTFYSASSLQVGIQLARTDRNLRLPFEGNSVVDVVGAGLTGAARDDAQHGYRNGLGPDLDFYANTETVKRVFGGLSAQWRPWNRLLLLDGRFGFDRRDAGDLQGIDPIDILGGRRTLRIVDTNRELRDGELGAMADYTVGGIYAATSLHWQRLTDRMAYDDSLAIEGAGGARIIDRRLLREYGLTLRQALDWRNVQAGAVFRRDAISGNEPGLSGSLAASWRVSGEPFFPKVPWLYGLSLRAAWGATERPIEAIPGIGSQRDPCTVTRCIGAGPEQLREVEGGFDASFGSERITLSLTGYLRGTRGLLLPAGITDKGEQQLVNAGAVRNSGAEATLRAALLRGGAVEWEAEVLGAVNHNRVTALDVARFPLGGAFDQYLVVGLPLGAYLARPVLSYRDVDGDGVITSARCPGTSC